LRHKKRNEKRQTKAVEQSTAALHNKQSRNKSGRAKHCRTPKRAAVKFTPWLTESRRCEGGLGVGEFWGASAVAALLDEHARLRQRSAIAEQACPRQEDVGPVQAHRPALGNLPRFVQVGLASLDILQHKPQPCPRNSLLTVERKSWRWAAMGSSRWSGYQGCPNSDDDINPIRKLIR
jgi:hypothetical protein